MKIIKQGTISNPLDLMTESFIDFNRLNGHWPDPAAAMETIFSWLNGHAVLTVADIENFHQAPDRADWPGWNHVGRHSEIGRLYWNWFFWNHPHGNLTFTDSPDFFGDFGPGDNRFYGDIGRVSVSAFSMSIKQLGLGDLWVSVLGNGSRHVIIESRVDIVDIYHKQIGIYRPA